MPHFDAVIFDMDGTLVDSEVVWARAEDDLFAALNIDYTDEVRQQVIGLRLDDFFLRLIDIYQLNASVRELSEDLTRRMLQLIPAQVEPKPGAHELVHYVAELGIPYCIASSSGQAVIDAIVKSQNWQDLITRRYTADLVPRGKPAPDVYLYAAEQLGVDPTRCLAIEDSPNGARAALAAGMTTYVVPDSHSPRARFAGVDAPFFDDLHAVLTHLRA